MEVDHDLVQLRHFVVLAELGTYVQASTALYLTQPALTRSIQALEAELGGQLFDRSGARIATHAVRSEMLSRAGAWWPMPSRSGNRKGTARGLVGTLRIGLSSGPGALCHSPLMLHMAQHHPRLHVQISRGSTGVLIDALRDQHLDALVVDARSVRPSADLEVSQVFELQAGFLVRRDHPLAKPAGRQPDEMLAYPMASTPLSDEVARA